MHGLLQRQIRRHFGDACPSMDGWKPSRVKVRETGSRRSAHFFAVWLDTIRQVIAENSDLLKRKVVVDPSNPLKPDGKGGLTRSLPEDQAAGSVVARLLPADAHYVKAFGTLGAPSLASGANRSPQRAVLFYATDDAQAAATIERLISIAGFDPVKAGGVKDAARIEVPGGDLHEYGGLHGRGADAGGARAPAAPG